MCRNEERWIERVLRPLWMVFGRGASSATRAGRTRRCRSCAGCTMRAALRLTEYGLLEWRRWGRCARSWRSRRGARGRAMRSWWTATSCTAWRRCKTSCRRDAGGLHAGLHGRDAAGRGRAGNFYEMTPPVGMNRTAIFLPEDSGMASIRSSPWRRSPMASRIIISHCPAGLSYHHVHLHRWCARARMPTCRIGCRTGCSMYAGGARGVSRAGVRYGGLVHSERGRSDG